MIDLLIYAILFILALGAIWWLMIALRLPDEIRMPVMIMVVIVGAVVLLRAGGLV